MSADANIKTIMGVYEAFGRGDVAAILDAVADDVDWAAEAAGTAAPWYGVRHGKDAVAKFFADFGSTMEVEEFTPVSIAANDTDVLTVVRFRARSLATGKTAAMDLHHYFTSATARSPTTAAPRTPPRPRPRSSPNPEALFHDSPGEGWGSTWWGRGLASCRDPVPSGETADGRGRTWIPVAVAGVPSARWRATRHCCACWRRTCCSS